MGRTILWAIFFAAHLQDIAPVLAPVASLLLFVRTRWTRWQTVGPLISIVALLWLITVSAVNSSWADLPIAQWVADHATVLYVIPLLLMIYSSDIARDWEHVARGLSIAVLITVPIPLAIWIVDRETTRFTGLLGINTISGALAVASCALVVHLLVSQELALSAPKRWCSFSAIIIALSGVIAGASRAFGAGLGAGILALAGTYWWAQRRHPARLVMIRSQRDKVILVAAIVLAVAGVTIAPRYLDQDARGAALRSSIARLSLAERSVDVWSQSPLVGLGIGTFEQEGTRTVEILPGVAVRSDGKYREEIIALRADGGQHTHNQFMQLLVEGGLIGAVLVVLQYLWPGLSVLASHRSHRSPALVAGAAGIMTLVCVSGIAAGRSMTSPSLSLIPFVMLAALHGVARTRSLGSAATRSIPRGVPS